jgi:hypothetical protein
MVHGGLHGGLHSGLHHETENNNLGAGRPFCIRFWETENNILVLFLVLILDIFSG